MRFIALLLALLACSPVATSRTKGALSMAFTLSPFLSETAMGVRTNMTPFANNCVTDTIPRDDGGTDYIYQYAPWFDLEPNNSNVTLAYRRRPANDLDGWETPVVQSASGDGLNGAIAGDGHFAISIGVDPSGRVHVTWRAHNADQVFYWRGTGPGDIEVTSKEDPAHLPMTAEESELTSSYWRFFNDPTDGNNLFATYRVGAPGADAEQALIAWDDAGAQWLTVSEAIIDWPGSGGDQESPYMQRVYVNPVTGRWHWAWIWARGATPETYHTLSYIYSDDQGVTWKAADGSAVTLPAGGPSTHPAVVAYDQQENSAMPVHGGHSAFVDDQPVIAYTAVSDTVPTDTDLYVLTYREGAWSRIAGDTVGIDWLHEESGGGPDNVDHQVGRFFLVPDGYTMHAIYRSNFEPDGVRVRSTFDNTCAEWSSPVTILDVSEISPAIDLDENEFTHDERAWGAYRRLYGYIQGIENTGRNYFAEITGLPEAPMGTLSAHSRNGLIGLAFGAVAFAPAATHYFAAFVAGVEVTGNNYSRAAMTNNTTTWAAAAARVKATGAVVTFDTATGGNWGTIDEIRIYDDPTAGNELARDDLAGTQAINDGQTLRIAIGAFTITAAAGSLSDDLSEALLDHQFGSTDYTPEATLEFAYFDGDPQGAGAEITGTDYARVTVDNDNVTWAAASSGLVRNLIAFTFPPAGAADWDTATYSAFYDAAGTGLMLSAILPAARAIANGETETIAAGRLRPGAFT